MPKVIMEDSNGATLHEFRQNGVINTTNIGTNGNANGKTIGSVTVLETASEKRERTISLIIVYFTLFLQSLGLAIAMTGVWPFLDKVR